MSMILSVHIRWYIKDQRLQSEHDGDRPTSTGSRYCLGKIDGHNTGHNTQEIIWAKNGILYTIK